MGARLVSEAIAFAADVPLNPNEFRLLIGMCLTALDQDAPGRPARRYFASREESAYYLGRRVPDRPADDDERKAREAALEAVKVAARGLVALEVVTLPDGPGRRGRRANYYLSLDVQTTSLTREYRVRLGRLILPNPEGSPFPISKAHPSQSGRLTLPPRKKEETERGTGGRTPPDASTSRVPGRHERPAA